MARLVITLIAAAVAEVAARTVTEAVVAALAPVVAVAKRALGTIVPVERTPFPARLVAAAIAVPGRATVIAVAKRALGSVVAVEGTPLAAVVAVAVVGASFAFALDVGARPIIAAEPAFGAATRAPVARAVSIGAVEPTITVAP